MKRKMAGLLAIVFVMMTALTGCSGGNSFDTAAEAVNVDGVSISMGELNFFLRYQQTQMQGMYGSLFGEDFMNQDIMGAGVPYGQTIRDTVVDTLEEYYIVEAHAGELDVALTEEEKTAAADAAKAFLAANDNKTLSAMSADETVVTHVLELAALQQKVYEKLAETIDTEVDPEEAAQKRISYVLSSTVGTTDEEGNVVELTEDELADKKAVLEEVLAEAKESKDLNAAAENHELSVFPATYGKDAQNLSADVVAAAEKLEEGEFSDVIESDNGYYIICMESTYDEEATQEKIESILTSRKNDAYTAWITPLKEAAAITVNEEQVGSLTFERIFTIPAVEE